MSDPQERTALYRIRGDADELLYIGMTGDLRARWDDHASKQPWWDELRSLTVEWYDSREEADDAERAAIKAEVPKYNKKYLGPRRQQQRPRPAPRPRICMYTEELVGLPVEIGIQAAGRLLGIGRGAAYLRAKEGTFPFPVKKVDGRYIVLKADVMHWLGLNMDGTPIAPPSAERGAA